MPKNISAETTQTALCFSCVSNAQPQACALQSGFAYLSGYRYETKASTLLYTFALRDFLGKNTTGGWRGKKICQKNDAAETFSPGDFLRHGGHEGSGYSAV